MTITIARFESSRRRLAETSETFARATQIAPTVERGALLRATVAHERVLRGIHVALGGALVDVNDARPVPAGLAVQAEAASVAAEFLERRLRASLEADLVLHTRAEKLRQAIDGLHAAASALAEQAGEIAREFPASHGTTLETVDDARGQAFADLARRLVARASSSGLGLAEGAAVVGTVAAALTMNDRETLSVLARLARRSPASELVADLTEQQVQPAATSLELEERLLAATYDEIAGAVSAAKLALTQERIAELATVIVDELLDRVRRWCPRLAADLSPSVDPLELAAAVRPHLARADGLVDVETRRAVVRAFLRAAGVPEATARNALKDRKDST